MPTCPHHPAETLLPVKKGWYCPECDRSVLSYDDHPRDRPPGAGRTSGLPFPVAHPLDHADDPVLSAGERLDNAIFAAYQAMRLTAVVLLADALDRDARCPELARPLRGLQMPHWREWSVLAQRLTALWRGHLPGSPPPCPSRFPALVEGWAEVNRRRAPSRGPWFPLLDGLPGLEGSARNANDALWRARNDRAHRQGTRTGACPADERRLARIGALVREVVGRLFPAGSLDLLREGGTVVAAGPHGKVDLYPFAVPGHMDGSDLDEPVCLIEGAGRRRVTVLGVRSSFERPDLADPFAAAMEAAAVELGGGWSLARRDGLAAYTALTASEQLDEIRGSAYLPACYLPRPGVDDVVAELASRPGKGLLVLGDAGAGKSSLLASLVEWQLASPDAAPARRGRGSAGRLSRYLAGDGDAVLVVRGRHLTGDRGVPARTLLCDKLMERAGVRSGIFDDLAHFADRIGETAGDDPRADRRVWIVIDGLDEAPRFTDLVAAVDSFLPALGRHPWLRLAVSMRTGAYQALARRRVELATRGSGVFEARRFWHRFADPDSGESVPYLALRPFGGDAQVRAAHDLRRRELPDRAASVEFADLSRDLRRLLRSPLHLHLFHETYRGEGTTPRELDARRLFDAYLRRLRRELPNARETLSWIGGELYRGRRAALPASAAEERVAEWRKRHGFVSTAQVVKLDPLEELVAAGVLTRREESGAAPDGGGFAFAHQRLCERVLREELERQLDGAEPDGPRLLAWAFHAVGEEGGAGSAPLLAVLEELVAERVAAGDADAVDTLLDLDDGGARDPLLAAAIRSLGPVWTGDDGGPASRVLAALGQRALASGEDHRRLEVPACQGRDWLTAAGYGAVASRVDAVRLAAHRAEVERSPVAPEARLGLARVLDDRGQLERLERDTAAARACFLESLELLRGLVVALPDDPSLRRDVSVALNRLGVCDRAAGSPATAAERFAESVATMEEICAGEGGSAFLGDLAITLSLAADLAGEGGDLAGARRAMDRCLATMDQALEGAPGRGDLRRDRAVALKDAAGFEWSAGEGARARELVDDALTELRSLVVDEPHRADLRRDLALVLVRAGTMGDGAGAREEARGRFREADGLLSGLCEAEPGRRDLWFELAVVRLNLAASAEGETAKAATQAAIEALERLGTLGPLSPAAERLWTLARRLRDNHPAPDDGGRTCT